MLKIIDTKIVKLEIRDAAKMARSCLSGSLPTPATLWLLSFTIYTNLVIGETFNNTEAKRCFATHDEDNDYFNMRIYTILIACVYIQQFNFIQ